MNLISLYYFVELAKELHVTNTAQRLYISQQNLTQHIQKLEQHYGVTLFHRKPKLALTYAGEQLYEAAVKILSEEKEFQNRLSEISEKNTGSIKLGIPAYRSQILLPQILPTFYEKWPNIQLELIDKYSEPLEQMLLNGELDLFLGIMNQDHQKLCTAAVLYDKIYMVCSDELLMRYFPDSFETIKKQSLQGVNLKTFAKVPFLLPHHTLRLRKKVDQCFMEAKVSPNIFLEASTTELLLSLYPYNYGALFCTQMRLPQLMQDHPDANIFPLLLQNEELQHRLVLAYHKDRALHSYTNDLIALFQKTMEEIASLRP